MNENDMGQHELLALLDQAIELKASDLHIVSGTPAMVRIDGNLSPLKGDSFTPETSAAIISGFIGKDLHEGILKTRQESDFSFSYKKLRVRCNAYLQRGMLSASFRILPAQVPTPQELGIPPIVSELVARNQGLFLVCGPTGHGKSTTLASLISQICLTRRSHVITIEDPIEYFYEQHKSIVSQREIGVDTPSYHDALRSALREDPDVVMVGEMRDLETIEATLEIAETGHLVFATLHTNSAAQTANRIIDVFPAAQKDQVRAQLADSLLGIISQRLLPTVKGGRVLAAEVLVVNQAIRTLIRDGKTHQIPNVMQTSASDGMISLDKSLAELVTRGIVSIEDALAWSTDPRVLKALIY